MGWYMLIILGIRWQEHYQCCLQQPSPSLLILFPPRAAVGVAFESGKAQKLRSPAPVSQLGLP